MLSALKLAELGRCTVSPNPMVGCLIVKNNTILGQGYHQHAGEAHAEIHALNAVGDAAKDATLYVTLEPCCHYGRTPPCVDAIITAGIKRVVVACLDPNELVAGKGIQKLQEAGIEVKVGVLENEAKELNKIFIHFITTKKPYVIAKWAMSLDGKTTTNDSANKVISNSESQLITHELRQQVDAVVIGSATAVYDDPALTVRATSSGSIHKQPIRIILASKGNLPLDLKIFANQSFARTLVATTDEVSSQWEKSTAEKDITVLKIKAATNGLICLSDFLTELGKMNITSVLIEGGMTLHHAFFANKLVNQVHVYIAPNIIGTESFPVSTQGFNVKTIGSNLHCTATIEDNNHV